MPELLPIEAPTFEVVEITGTIEFKGGHQVTFTLRDDHDSANGEQPWIGKSVDVRQVMREAVMEAEFFDDLLVECPNCGQRVDELDYPDKPYAMCDGCEHDARRSGWEPGQEE